MLKVDNLSISFEGKEIFSDISFILNDREKLILTLRFFNGRTQMEVADEIGISQAQVSRLEKIALKHMKKYV